MVQLDVLVVRATREDSTVVVLEGASSHGDGKWTNLKTTLPLSINMIQLD